MTTRPVSATIQSATGDAREGLRVDFHATPPAQSVHAVTDADWSFPAQLAALAAIEDRLAALEGVTP